MEKLTNDYQYGERCPRFIPVYAWNGTDCENRGYWEIIAKGWLQVIPLIISAYRLFWSQQLRLGPWAVRDWCLYWGGSFLLFDLTLLTTEMDQTRHCSSYVCGDQTEQKRYFSLLSSPPSKAWWNSLCDTSVLVCFCVFVWVIQGFC